MSNPEEGKLYLVRLTNGEHALARYWHESTSGGNWQDALTGRFSYHPLAVESWREIAQNDIERLIDDNFTTLTDADL